VYDGVFNLILPFETESVNHNALLRNDGIFNYVTSYCYKTQLWNQIPVISDADYADFKN
jgi:hypothetical protein